VNPCLIFLRASVSLWLKLNLSAVLSGVALAKTEASAKSEASAKENSKGGFNK